MNNSHTMNVPARADKEYEAAIDGYLQEMEQLRRDMVARQKRIDNTQAETRALLAQLKELRAS